MKIDQVKIEEYGIIFIRQVSNNGDFHRITLSPGSNIINYSQEIQDICNQTWTPEVVASYQAYLASLPEKLGA